MPLLLNLSNYYDGQFKKSFSGSFRYKSAYYDYSFELPNSSIVDLKLMLSHAAHARKKVMLLSFEERAAILKRAAEAYVVTDEELDHVVKMTGMPRMYVKQRADFGKIILQLLPQMIGSRYGHKFGTITKEILRNGNGIYRLTGYESHRSVDGVIAAFVPPNDPAEVPFLLGHMVMYGGAAIIKPSASEPYFAVKIAELLTNAGYPAGALNVIHWDTRDSTRTHVSQELIRCSTHRIIMGGKQTADMLLKVVNDEGLCIEEHYSTGKNCIFSSGNSKAIVCPGSDVEETARMLVEGAYEWTRDCVTTKSVFVVGEEMKVNLIHAIQRRLKDKKVGDPLDPATEIGYNEDHEKIIQTIKGLVEFKYATLHFGEFTGITPFLIETNSIHSPLLQQEFSYTLTIVPVQTVEEAVEKINEASATLDDKMSMAVSVFSPHKTMEEMHHAAPEQMNKLLTLRCHLLMYNKPSIMLNVFLRHQDMLLTEFLTQPMSINHD